MYIEEEEEYPDPSIEQEWLDYHLKLADSYPRDEKQQIAAVLVADYQSKRKAYYA